MLIFEFLILRIPLCGISDFKIKISAEFTARNSVTEKSVTVQKEKFQIRSTKT